MGDPVTSLAPLAQYGPTGLVIGVLGVFLWAFRRLFEHVLDQQKSHQEFMTSAVNALKDLTQTIEENHESIKLWFNDITERINLVSSARERQAQIRDRRERESPTPKPYTPK
jgi:hypothetical protein